MTILTAIESPSDTKLIEQASQLARAYDDELVVLHVFTREEFEDRAEGRDDYYLDDGAYDAAKVSEAATDAVLSGDTPNVFFQGRIGEPTEEILDEAKRTNARYLVVGGRKRSPVGKAVFGDTTQEILLHATLPVVTVME